MGKMFSSSNAPDILGLNGMNASCQSATATHLPVCNQEKS
jgi:hypothetical protein